MDSVNNEFNNSIINIDSIINSTRNGNTNLDRKMESVDREFRLDEERIYKEESKNDIYIMIYRFKFTDDFISELYKFSKIHQYDDRKDFKEAWKIWTEENNEIIVSEMCRLLRLGYSGDIMDKMFKSARYYFRKKTTEKKEPKQRRQYISVNRELLDGMDNHIEKNIYNATFQPKNGFVDFCKNNESLLKDTIAQIFEQGIKDKELIEDKIKKTYKNRYFRIANNKL
jgi:DNA polymerase III delta prime subunit